MSDDERQPCLRLDWDKPSPLAEECRDLSIRDDHRALDGIGVRSGVREGLVKLYVRADGGPVGFR